MPDPAFNPGFRFTILDGLILLGGAGATIGVASLDRWTGVAIAFVVLHFFLFCNVLRMPRPLELMWAALFAILAIFATATIVTWPFVLSISLLATVIITIVQMRRPSYHGVAWKTLNPRLPQWWRNRTSRE